MENKMSIILAIAITAMICIGGMSILGGGSSEAQETELSVTGSTTVQPLMSLFKENYENVTVGVSISITGGGSGQGISSAAQGTVDIGMASRALKSSEKTQYPDLVETKIANDGVAVIVGSNAGVTALTMEQIRGVYNGTYTNWNQVGGNDATIVVYNREASSGTRDCFESVVMGGSHFVLTANEVASNGAMKTSVANNQNAIGYVGLGYLDETTNEVTVDGVEPTVQNVRDEIYPISRGLFLLTDGAPAGWAGAFINWILSPAGQELVAQKGFVPL